MRKLGLSAVTALIPAGFAGWITLNTQAGVASLTNSRIDVLRIMTVTGNLPTQQIVDHSL